MSANAPKLFSVISKDLKKWEVFFLALLLCHDTNAICTITGSFLKNFFNCTNQEKCAFVKNITEVLKTVSKRTCQHIISVTNKMLNSKELPKIDAIKEADKKELMEVLFSE